MSERMLGESMRKEKRVMNEMTRMRSAPMSSVRLSGIVLMISRKERSVALVVSSCAPFAQ